jgi:MFS family permease
MPPADEKVVRDLLPGVAGPEPASASAPVSGTRWAPLTWALLLIVCGALFLDALDTSMVSVALPSIGRDMHIGPGTLQWVVSGYVLGYGGLLLLGGRAADLIGRRQVFLVSMAVFGVASLVSAFMSNDVALIALRFIKGASAGFTVPAGLSIVTTTFTEGRARSRALGIYSACAAGGFSLGLVFSGLLTEISWRATLFAPGPAAILLVLLAPRVVPRSERQSFSLNQFDLPGAVTSTVALLLLVYALVEAPTRGWGNTATIASFGATGVLFAAFVVIEQHHPRPLVRLGMLRSLNLVHANFVAACLLGSFLGFQFIVTLYVQDSLGWSPLKLAVAVLPLGGLMFLLAPRTGPLFARLHPAWLALAAMTAEMIGYLLLLRVQPSMTYAVWLLPTEVLVGLAFGLGFPAVNVQATAGIADNEQGLASGLVNTSLQIGGAIVLAIVTALLGGTPSTHNHELLPGTTTALTAVVIIAGLGVLTSAVRVTALQFTPGSNQDPHDI